MALSFQVVYHTATYLQDAFARYSRSAGRPAVSIGLLSDTSQVEQRTFVRATKTRNGLYVTGVHNHVRVSRYTRTLGLHIEAFL